MDTADACHALGIKMVAVTAGYIRPEARRDLYAKMDAANVDLKAFTEEFYAKQTASSLAPVNDTLSTSCTRRTCGPRSRRSSSRASTTPTRELTELTEWVARELGRDVPLHFSAFHPDYRMTDVEATPPETLRRARAIARKKGLRYVYTGNVHDRDGDTTTCPRCGADVIVRDWYEILAAKLAPGGRCGACAPPSRAASAPGSAASAAGVNASS